MANFITLECNPAGELNFFHSGAYDRPSFSTTWNTRLVPDVDDLGSVPVYQQVLNKFGIPIDLINGQPPGGFLPGIDIRNMDAIQAIRLSMAEALISRQWWELYEDGSGGVRFLNVFNDGSPGKTVTLDIRLCIPSATKDNEVDMVIVHGYKKPPQRYAGEFRDVIPAGTGPINPPELDMGAPLFSVALGYQLSGCVSSQLSTEFTKSYEDPIITNQYGPQERNPFYNVKAFENIIAYVSKITGMPTSSDEAARVKYTFNDTTTWYYKPTFPGFSKVTEIVADCSGGIQTGGEIVFYEAEVLFTSPLYTDRYGTFWPAVIRPAEIVYEGYKIIDNNGIVNFGGTGPEGSTFVFVNPVPDFIKLTEGSQWIYTIPEGTSNQFKIKMFYQPKTDPLVWDFILGAFGTSNVVVKVADGRVLFGQMLVTLDFASSALNSTSGIGIMGGSGLGYLVSNLWLGLTIDRPSVTITDPGGQAGEYASNFRMEYAPLILFNPPEPIAYKHITEGSVIVDQTVGLEDHDPTTCQSFEETPLGIMQDLTTGNTIEVSLPFCQDEDACLAVAQTIFDYQTHGNIQTYVLTCGPDDEPELGAAVSGFGSDLRIESINYSFQDSSAYTIEVTLGPVFSNVGSWNNGAWVPKTEDVERTAIVRYTAGDGVNYRVYVQGLGEFNAINAAKDVWRVGETVSVTVYNIPQER